MSAELDYLNYYMNALEGERTFRPQPEQQEESDKGILGSLYNAVTNPPSLDDIPAPIRSLIRNTADTATSQLGLQLKGAGLPLNQLADTADSQNNPNVNGALYRALGGLLGDAGNYLYEAANTPERETLHPSEEWQKEKLQDILSDPEKLGRYITDPRGLAAELGSGFGSALEFAALARLFPAGAATGVASKALNPASALLEKAGAGTLARAVGSNTAKEMLGTGIQFGTTMAPAGALTNAATIIDTLREQGYSDSEINDRMWSLMKEELPADIAFAMLTGNVGKGVLANLASKNAPAMQKALATALGVPLEGFGGYYSNVNQAILAEKYSNQPYGELFGEHTPYENAAGRLGILAGLPFSVQGMYQGAKNAKAREQIYNQVTPEMARQAYSDATAEQAKRIAADMANPLTLADDANNPFFVQNRAEKLLEARALESYLASLQSQPQQETAEPQRETSNKEPPSLPTFDITAEDENTQTLFGQFAKEQYAKAIENQDLEKIQLFDNMFDDSDTFINTPENRVVLRELYSAELTPWATERLKQETAQPQEKALEETQQESEPAEPQTNLEEQKQAEPPSLKQEEPPKQQDKTSKYLNNAPEIVAGNRFLEELREKGNQPETTLKLTAAINSGDVATVKDILKANNVSVTPIQQDNASPAQTAVAQENQQAPAEKEKPKGKIALTEREKLLLSASRPVKKGIENKNSRIKIGSAILTLARQENMDIPAAERIALEKGSTKIVDKWNKEINGQFYSEIKAAKAKQAQNRNKGKNAEPTAQPAPVQESPQQETAPQTPAKQEETQPTLKERARQIIATAREEENALKLRQEREEKEKEIKTRREQEQKDLKARIAQIEQEEYERDLKAKQDIELQQLEERKAENKRLAAERAKATAERNKEFAARGTLAKDIAKVLEPPSLNKNKQKRQGVAIVNLINSTPFKDMFGVISLPKPVEISLREGNAKAIETAQEHLLKQGVTPVEWRQGTTAEQQPRTEIPKRESVPKTAEEGAAEQRTRNQKKAQRQHELQERQRQREEEEDFQNELQFADEMQEARIERAENLDTLFSDEREARAEQDSFEDELQFEDEMMESRINKAEDLEELFGEEKHRQREEDLPPTKENIDQEIKTEAPEQQRSNIENEPSSVQESPKAESIAKEKATFVPKQENQKSTPKGNTATAQTKTGGNTAKVLTGNRNEHTVRYKVVEADELTSSHRIENDGVFSNKAYPTELQPRDRSRSNMQAGLIKMSNNLSPADLMESRDVNQGAPLIRSDGVVLNGNGRTAAIRYAYENGKAAEYKTALIQNAERLGLSADAISKMKQPVLVREIEGDLTNKQVKDITGTQTGGARMSASEQAKADGESITSYTLEMFPQNDDADISAAYSENFLRSALNDIASPDELNALTTSDGRISQDGLNRVKRGLFAKAYGAGELIGRMSESTDDKIVGVTNAMLTAAPKIAKLKSSMASGRLHKYDLKAIPEAAQKLASLRAEKKTVSNYLQEQSLFDEHTDSEEMREILSTFDRYKRSPKKIANFLKNIAQAVIDQGDPRQGNLFGESSKPTPLVDVIRKAKEKTENTQGNLFSEKQSKEGNAELSIENVVDEKDLTPQQKLLKTFGDKLGVKTVFVNDPNGDAHGGIMNGTIYINVNSKMPISKVFWHEALHWLKADNAKLHTSLTNAVGITEEQRDAYLERTKRTDLETDEAIDEEILADQMEDVAGRTGLLQSIAGKNRGLVQRVVQWLKDTMNKFIDHFRNPQGKLTTVQAQAMAAEFGKIAKELKDADGKAIFRYNNRTRDIEVIGGRKFESAESTKDFGTKYSIGNSDNSNESLSQKIKNKLSSLFTGETSPKRRNAEITRALSKLSGHRIIFGYVDGADDVVIDDLQKIIRSRHAYDWGKLLPAVSGKIAKNLKLPATPEMNTYIADWLLTGALNNTSQQATEFQKAMRENPAMAEIMQSVRDTFQEFTDMTAQERIASTIVDKQKQKSELFSKEEWVDDLAPIQNMVDRMMKEAKPEVAKIIKESLDPYISSRLLKGKGALADMMIGERGMTEEQVKNIRAALAAQDPATNFSNFTPLAVIIEKADNDVRGLETFALAKLDKEIHQKNNAKNEKGEPKYKYVKPSFSEADDDEVIKAGEKKFGKAHKALVEYSNILLTMQYSAGLLTPTQYYSIINSWENYIPTARVFDENEDFDLADSLKEKTGSKRDTYSPIQKIAANTGTFLRQAERNKVKLEIATLARCGNFGDIIAEVPKGVDHGNIVRFKENGKIKYLETPDKALVRAIESIQTPADSNAIKQVFKIAMNFLRAAMTGRNLDFIAGNPFRDLADAYIHNKNLNANPITALLDVFKASVSSFKSLRAKDQDYWDFKAFGGTQSGFVSESADTTGRAIRKLTGNTSRFRKILDTLDELAEASENITRLSTYKSSKKELAAQHGGVATPADLRKAALAAREASVDFARAGKSMRTINKAVLFSNAAVQGLALWGEKLTRLNTKAGQKEAFFAATRLVMMAVIPALIEHALNYSDDDRRKKYENRPDWEKDTYWIFGDGIRIPKGMDVGIRLVSALMEETMKNDPASWRRVWKNFAGGFPSITSTIFTPALESYANYSIFRDAPVVPYSEQQRSARNQYGIHTSWVAKEIGDKLDYSPRKIDYLISGYLGFMGKFFTGGTEEFPMTRRFLFDPYKNPKIVQDYYEALDKQETMLRDYKFEKERQKGHKVELPKEYDATLHKRLKSVQEKMRELSKKEKEIIDDQRLTRAQREEKLQKLEEKRIKLCEKALNKAR